MNRAEKIITVAKSYVGIKEKTGNKGFWNAAFEKLMIVVGWYVGAAWCAFFTKNAYLQAYSDNKAFVAVIKNCFTGGAVDTFNRVKANGTFATGTIPKNGAIVVFRMGDTSRGHHGIIVNSAYATNTMQTVEGNTNSAGSREGDTVAIKLRTITRDFKADGLNVVGYIYPFEV